MRCFPNDVDAECNILLLFSDIFKIPKEVTIIKILTTYESISLFHVTLAQGDAACQLPQRHAKQRTRVGLETGMHPNLPGEMNKTEPGHIPPDNGPKDV